MIEGQEPLEMCACGEFLHYSNPAHELMMRDTVRLLGTHIEVHCQGRTWLVQRHYIALHGLKAVDLPMSQFEEVTKEKRI